MTRVDFSLYLVTDRHQTHGRPLVPLLQSVFEAGLPAVQVREKDLNTRALLTLTHSIQQEAGRSTHVFVNDRIDIVLALGLGGVHLRTDSLPVRAARRLLGSGPLIGISTHGAEEVRRAEADGADFAVLGPIYDTPSKRPFGEPIGLGPLQEAAQHSRLLIFAIGGIMLDRVREVRSAGASGIGVITAILAAESPGQATAALLSACSIFSR